MEYVKVKDDSRNEGMKCIIHFPEKENELNQLLGVDTALPNDTFLLDFFNKVGDTTLLYFYFFCLFTLFI